MSEIETCTWTEYDPDYCGDTWETECGEMFRIIEGTPKMNGMKYCPYCGGTIVMPGGGVTHEAAR